MAVAGAYRYLTSANLANTQGLAAVRPTLIGGGSAQSMLDVAKARGSIPGIGLSARSRALAANFIQQTSGGAVGLFGASSGAQLTTADLATQIKALRSSLPRSQISDLVLAAEAAREEEQAEAREEALLEQARNLVNQERGVSLDEYQERLEETLRILRAREERSGATSQAQSFRRGELINQEA